MSDVHDYVYVNRIRQGRVCTLSREYPAGIPCWWGRRPSKTYYGCGVTAVSLNTAGNNVGIERLHPSSDRSRLQALTGS
jgi:hypothetical protein